LHPLREAGEVGVLQLGDHQGEGAVNPPRSSRPARLGTYPSSAIACSTRARVSALTTGRSLTTLETVFQDTPACWATSLMLTRRTIGFLRPVGDGPRRARGPRGSRIPSGHQISHVGTRDARPAPAEGRAGGISHRGRGASPSRRWARTVSDG